MMECDSNSAGSRELYVAETRRRTAGMLRILLSLQDDRQGQLDHLLGQLQEQTGASHSNGFDGVARLCQSMENCLARIDSAENLQAEAAISALIESCRVISEHAETISAIAGGPVQPCRWKHATTASSITVRNPKSTLCTNRTNPRGEANGKSTKEPD